MKPQAFIFIGRAGSGKGTQAELLIQSLKSADPSRAVLDIQPGGEFRTFVHGNSFTQHLAKKINDAGDLQPEFLPIYMWSKIIIDQYTGNEHLIFDGAPRRILEAQILNTIFDFYGIEQPWVIHIDLTPEQSTKRLLLRGRVDDTEAGIRERLMLYDTDVTPTVDYYRSNPRYRYMDVDGDRSVEAIHADIVKRLGLV